MFNEREALKTRLEQLVSMEEKIVNLYREERNEIFSRLRELDNVERKITLEKSLKDFKITDHNDNYIEKVNNVDHLNEQINVHLNRDNGLPKRRYPNKTEILRNAIVDILKKHNVAIPLKQLKHEIEMETGIEIANISLFMTKLVKEEESVKKVTHGQYMYSNNKT